MRAPKENEAPQPTKVLLAGSSTAWNIGELRTRLDNDQEFLRELLQIFVEDSQNNLKRAKSAMGAGDLDGVMRAGHTLKGMLRNLSMHRAAEAALALETEAREGHAGEAESCLAKLQQEIAALLPEVDAHLAEVSA